MGEKKILNAKEIDIILHRLACQLIENHNDFSETVLIGIQPRGTYLLDRILEILKKENNIENIEIGQLDITFYRDDFRRRDEPLQANTTTINTILENKRVVFIDDVLYTGRSIRAALTAIESYGRPADIELLVLIDRRFSRNLPIQPTYLGKQVDAVNNEKVLVEWHSDNSKNTISLIQKNN
ncbi:MAG TPA: bifunctional pyr operon transcriptional regulator/uracil phosphoribosyltransferase PyrR [Lutibacter sp.]|nr:bifunctional pyr operon transcriptional regulator/uracil phosphoribosyltransferase PyrR [Lutibacter sp.]